MYNTKFLYLNYAPTSERYNRFENSYLTSLNRKNMIMTIIIHIQSLKKRKKIIRIEKKSKLSGDRFGDMGKRENNDNRSIPGKLKNQIVQGREGYEHIIIDMILFQKR